MTKWSEEELAILANAMVIPKKERPSYKVIARDLPGRSVNAIKAQRLVQLNSGGSGLWSSYEIATLKKNLPEDKAQRATAGELAALLPGRSYYAIHSRITILSLPRPRRRNEKPPMPTWPEDMPYFQDDPRALVRDYTPMPSKRGGYIVRGNVR